MAIPDQSQVERLEMEARACPPEQRAEFLARACGSDALLRARVQARLVRSLEQALYPTAIDSPAPTPMPFPPDPGARVEPGTSIGPYTISRMLGSGGFGAVYLAQQSAPIRRQVALKIIKLGMDTREVVTRFEAERQALAMMDHPGVARVFDAGATDRGRPYFAMEYVPGLPIHKHSDMQRLSTRERVKLFIEVCHAVQHAHQKGVIHRDIKPSNILVTTAAGRAQPKIIDFGIAKATSGRLTEASLNTEVGRAIGTPEYMSPEQSESDGSDIDTRTDVYSLGMVLYELLTGALPHTLGSERRPSIMQLREWMRTGEPLRPTTRLALLEGKIDEVSATRRTTPTGLRKELKGDLEWILLKALERDRNRRYGSAVEFGNDLERFLQDEPVIAGPPTAAYRMHKFVRRHRGGVFAGIAMTLALIAGTALATLGFVSANRAAQAEKQAHLQSELALADAQTQRNLAEREAAVSREVSDFLVRMLTSVDPAVVGPEVRVIDILALAEADLESGSIAEPTVAATIQGAIGESYLALSDYYASEPLLKDRLKTFTDIYGPDDPRTIAAIRALAMNQIRLARYDEARAELEPLISRCESLFGPDHAETRESLETLARLEMDQGNYPKGEELFTEIVRRTRSADPDSVVDIAKAEADVAWAYFEQHKLDAAKDILERDVQILERQLGPKHIVTLRIRDGLANALMLRGEHAEATRLFETNLAIRREQFDDSNPLTLWAMNNLANSLIESTDRIDEARELLEHVLELQRDLFGNRHPHSITSMNNLAGVYKRLGRIDDADKLYLESIEQARALWGPTNPRTLGGMVNRAAMLSVNGREEEARVTLEQALPLIEQSIGKDQIFWLSAANSLGIVQMKTGHADEAVATYEELIAQARQSLPEGHWYIPTFRAWYGISLARLERNDEAERELTESVQALAEHFGNSHPRVQGPRNELIALYEKLGRDDAAAAVREKYPDPDQ